MIVSRTYLILSRICFLIVLIVGISAIVYAFMGQWGNAGQSLYTSILILVMGFIANDYHTHRMTKVRR